MRRQKSSRQKQGRFQHKKKPHTPASPARKAPSAHAQPKSADAKNSGPGKRQGILTVHPDGYGFVLAARKGDPDVFVPAHLIGDALHTDLVEVDARPSRGEKWEGKITQVLERNLKIVIGHIEHKGKVWELVTEGNRVQQRILIPQDKLMGAGHQQSVAVRILEYPEKGSNIVAEVIDILGERGELATEAKAIILQYQLPTEFPAIVQAEASKAEMHKEDYAGREDLRHLPFVTIDGETAKDFDDAVFVEHAEHGKLRLWVSIADVAHFVRPGTELDDEALMRGTSVYFPNTVIPMLPEQLSNDLCSLRPNVDRFTMTAVVEIDQNGSFSNPKFFNSVIRSQRRCTYTEVKKLLVDKDPVTIKAFGDLVKNFGVNEECYRRLRRKRQARGTIDFDLPEPQIELDMTGDVQNIVKSERHVGHMMIEEFMIAANEAVAEHLTQSINACVYRIHEEPSEEKLQSFLLLAHNLGYKIPKAKKLMPKQLGEFIKTVAGKPEERLLNHTLLRCMAKAVYSSENAGHYGLASEFYCHFTSPIRRYPDLIVHRLLKAELKGAGKNVDKEDLQTMADHCSRRERVSMESERDMAKLYAALFMRDKVGQEFTGIISHVTKFGFFVELIEYFVEGLVRITSLTSDRFFFDEEHHLLRGRKRDQFYRIGMPVKIRVTEVDMMMKTISFELVEESA